MMTIKKQIGKKRKATRLRSSFSDRAAASRPLKDVLELGRHLVAELKLEESRDTLAKWLAYHVAELIVDAEQARDAKGRREAADHAVDSILKVWALRVGLPGNANPLAPYRNMLRVLSDLNPERNNWAAFAGHNHLVVLHRRFLRLMRTLLVLELPQTGKGSGQTREIVHNFLEHEEGRLLDQLEVLLAQAGSTDGGPAHQKKLDDFARVRELANKLIDETIADLQTLRKHSVPTTGRPKKA